MSPSTLTPDAEPVPSRGERGPAPLGSNPPAGRAPRVLFDPHDVDDPAAQPPTPGECFRPISPAPARHFVLAESENVSHQLPGSVRVVGPGMTADSLNPSPPTEETFPQSSRQAPTHAHPLQGGLRQQQQPEPIYAHLVKAWHHEGRTVPGEPDLEWRRLTKALRIAPLPTPRDGRVLTGKHRRDPEGQQK